MHSRSWVRHLLHGQDRRYITRGGLPCGVVCYVPPCLSHGAGTTQAAPSGLCTTWQRYITHNTAQVAPRWPVYYMAEVHNTQHHTTHPPGGLCTALDKYMTGGCVVLCTSPMYYTSHRRATYVVLCVMYLSNALHSPPGGYVVWCCVLCTSPM